MDTGIPRAAGSHPGRGRTSEAEQRRRILDAARGLFAEVGYHGFSVVAVADRAGIPRSTVYRLYADRRALLASLIDLDVEQLVGRLTLNIPADGPLADMLTMSIGIWFDFVDERRSEYALLFGHTGRYDPDVANLLLALRDRLADTYRRIFLPVLIAEGGESWTEVQSLLITHAAMSLVEGATQAWITEAPLDRDRVVEIVATMIHDALRPGGGPVMSRGLIGQRDPGGARTGAAHSDRTLLGRVAPPIRLVAQHAVPGG